MPTPPEGAQMSEDGHWWWDGTQWISADQSAGSSEATPGASSLDTPINWHDYPELYRATTYGADIDAYLTDIGVDPSVITAPGNA
jgi:hypothetical protein